MSKELLAIPSLPPPGPDREALLASMLVRLDALESEVRALQRADGGHEIRFATIEGKLEEIRAELASSRAAGDEKLAAIKTQLDDSAELVGAIMRSQAAIARETAAQTRKLDEAATQREEQGKKLDGLALQREQFFAALFDEAKARLPSKWMMAGFAFAATVLVTASSALLQFVRSKL